MRTTPFQSIQALVFFLFVMATAAPAFATSFTVHGWERGDDITLLSGRTVATAQLDVSLENGPQHIAAYCVDLNTYINVGVYDARAVLDAGTATSPSDEAPRNFAWAGHVMDNFGHDITGLTGAGFSRTAAITGVQAAIWEGLYGGGVIDYSSLSTEAQSVYDTILQTQIAGDGPALVVDLVGKQDQIISGGANPVPEPSAAIVFAVGTLIAGSAAQRRNR